MRSGFQKIFWGFIIITIHINLPPIQILPAFFGWMVLYFGIHSLNKDKPNAALNYAKVIALISAGITFVTFSLKLVEINPEPLKYVDILVEGLLLLFVYQYLSGVAEYFKTIHSSVATDYFYKMQRFLTLAFLLDIIVMSIAYIFTISGVTMIYIIIHLNIMLWIVYMTHNLKKEVSR